MSRLIGARSLRAIIAAITGLTTGFLPLAKTAAVTGITGTVIALAATAKPAHAIDWSWFRNAVQGTLSTLARVTGSAKNMATAFANWLRNLFGMYTEVYYNHQRRCYEIRAQNRQVYLYCEITEKKQFWFQFWTK